jgi:hypothetical protein
MVETFTPAGCGGRTRQFLAVLMFGVGAIAAAAALGGALGCGGSLIPSRWLPAAVAAACVLGALRELGVVPLPLPMVRRQVPEAWRRERPLAVWSTGYGAILGAGFGTYQPAATFWVVCAAAVALGRPAAAAVCLGAFGLGRVLMVAFPGDPLQRLAGAHRMLRPANATVLLVLAALLVPGAAGAAEPAGRSDPSASGGALTFTERSGGTSRVVVQTGGLTAATFADARMPALSGGTLAYVDTRGIRIVLWRTGEEILRIGGRVDTPALSGPRVAYVEAIGGRTRLLVRNFSTGVVRVITTVGPGVDLGRPALAGQLVAWHEGAGSHNRILLRAVRGGRTRVMAEGGRSGLTVNPALVPGHIAWVESRAERSSLFVRRLPNGPPRLVAGALGPTHLLWNTAIDAAHVYVTRWNLATNTGAILRYRWR